MPPSWTKSKTGKHQAIKFSFQKGLKSKDNGLNVKKDIKKTA
jgi:hypothetical protein